MGRHFLQMGPRSTRASFGPATFSLTGTGQSFNATAVLLGGTGSMTSAGARVDHSAVLLGGTGQITPRAIAIARVNLGISSTSSMSLGGSSTLGTNWNSSLPDPISFNDGTSDTFDLRPYLQNFNSATQHIEVKSGSGPLPANVTLDPLIGPVFTDTAADDSASSATPVIFTVVDNAITPSQDWANRIAGAQVVWYHSFDTAAEVNQFRWSGGIGNNPNGTGDGARVQWISTGGADGGAFLRNLRGAGTTGDGSNWWRPLNPMNAASNGRGVADPAANGSIPLASFSPTQGGSQTQAHQSGARPGWYGHVDYWGTSTFDGSDFYLQIRVRRSNAVGAPGGGVTGKGVWLTALENSYVVQELVTYGFSDLDVAGQYSVHNIYQGFNYQPVASICTVPPASGTLIQRGSSIPGVCDWYQGSTGGCWRYSGGWDTLLYHITPGHNAVADTRLEVWAQHDLGLFPAEAGVYQKIWDVIYPANFDTVGTYRAGWNALICGMYHNGVSMAQFSQDFDQIIFSKATIAAPQV